MRIGVPTAAPATRGQPARGLPRQAAFPDTDRPDVDDPAAARSAAARPDAARSDADHAGAPRRDAPAATVGLLPGRVVAYAWLLAGIPLAALQVAHSGLHERNELPPLLHWLRDTSLAVPVAALAVVVAAFVIVRVRPAGSRQRGSLASAAGLGFLAAAIFAVLAIPLSQVHGALFGAEPETGMTPLQHAVTEGIAVFQVALVLVPVVLVAGVPWRTSRPDPVPTPTAGLALEGADR